jgi:hypothetical protein
MSGRLVVAAAVALATAPAACGGDGGEAGSAGGGGDAGEPGAAHIHGLGINPADGSLMIATHGGMFRAAAGEQRARRVGERFQDTMGFTVVGPDRFLGSGHPDVQGFREGLPPLLGLIRSDDAGRRWKPVSLLGKADFHVLRVAGRRIYGVNASDGLLMVSDDGGRRWARRTPPGPLVDLAAEPDDPDHVVASEEDGLHVSRDAGAGWRPLDTERAGLLTWPAPDALYLVDGAGTVHRSSDAGRSWDEVGEVGGQPAAFAAHGSTLYVALHTNDVKVSDDGGRSWAVRVSAPA